MDFELENKGPTFNPEEAKEQEIGKLDEGEKGEEFEGGEAADEVSKAVRNLVAHKAEVVAVDDPEAGVLALLGNRGNQEDRADRKQLEGVVGEPAQEDVPGHAEVRWRLLVGPTPKGLEVQEHVVFGLVPEALDDVLAGHFALSLVADVFLQKSFPGRIVRENGVHQCRVDEEQVHEQKPETDVQGHQQENELGLGGRARYLIHFDSVELAEQVGDGQQEAPEPVSDEEHHEVPGREVLHEGDQRHEDGRGPEADAEGAQAGEEEEGRVEADEEADRADQVEADPQGHPGPDRVLGQVQRVPHFYNEEAKR